MCLLEIKWPKEISVAYAEASKAHKISNGNVPWCPPEPFQSWMTKSFLATKPCETNPCVECKIDNLRSKILCDFVDIAIEHLGFSFKSEDDQYEFIMEFFTLFDPGDIQMEDMDLVDIELAVFTFAGTYDF